MLGSHRRGLAKLLLLALAAPAFPQALIHGVVETIEDELRLPVAEAAVRAFVSDEAVSVAFSDREGRYILKVPARAFELRLAKPGYVVAHAAGLRLPGVRRNCRTPGDCGQVDFLLKRAAAFELWLADPSGDPFPLARVQLTPEDAAVGDARIGFTDDRGVERFYDLSPGRYRLDVHADGVYSDHGRLYEIDSVDLELRPGENAPLHVSARRAGAETFSLSAVIEGVSFEDRSYTVHIRALGEQSLDGYSFKQFTPQLSIPRLPRGEYVIELHPDGVRSESQPMILGRFRLDENRSGLVLRPSEPATLVGNASFEEGVPDHVNLDLRSGEGWTWRTIHVERRFPHFKVDSAPPGTYSLVAAGDGFFLVESPTIQLSEGSGRAVNVTLSARFGRVQGVVRGATVHAPRVELTGPQGKTVVAPGADSAFAFERLLPGDYALCTAVADEPCAEERIRRFALEPGDEVEIDLGARQ